MDQSFTSKLVSWLTAFLPALFTGAGLIFLIFAIRRSRLPYNSEGNYFDGVVNYHEQSVDVLVVMTGASFLVAATLFGIGLLVRNRQ